MKKKIVFVNANFQRSDGTVRALIELCNCLDPEKFDITIMPFYKCDMEFASEELRPDIKVKKAIGFYFRGLSRILSLIPMSFFYRQFIAGKYDIEVAFQYGMSTKIVCNKRNERVVKLAWMHGYGIYPDLYRNVDKVVCVSEVNAERCRSELPYDVDVTCCYNLLQDEEIRKKSLDNVCIPEGSGPILVTVGRLSPEKGYFRLIRICGELKREGLKFRLMIIGGGTEESKLRNAIMDNSLEDSVFLLGKQDNPYKFVSRSDLFVCSSFDEGYSTACTEAAILGIPIVTTDVSGGREIIDECECGLVTGVDDASLKEGLRIVISDLDKLNSWKVILSRTRIRFFAENRKRKVTELFDDVYELSESKNL